MLDRLSATAGRWRPKALQFQGPAGGVGSRARTALGWSTFVIFVTFGLVGGWFAIARLDSAAVAPGIVTIEGNIKTIQHLEGGIVSEIAVQNGQLVQEGDLLVRLDSTQRQASSSLYRQQLLGANARRARLEAERNLQDQINFPDDVLAEAETTPEVGRIVADEKLQFSVKLGTLNRTVDILKSQITQSQDEVRAITLQQEIARKELAFVDADLQTIRGLRQQGLAEQSRLTTLERDSLSLQEKVTGADIQIAQTNQAISGLQLQIEQAREAYRQTASEELQLVTEEIRNLSRDTIVADDSLRRVDIRSPVTGTVQESGVFTVGAVVTPGEVIMRIAPASRDFVITARISPNDIDAITPGSSAEVRFPAFQNIEMAPFHGELISVSRDRIIDQVTQNSYFEALVRLDEDAVPDNLLGRLVAGMSADVILPTGERTALAYLVSPILRRLNGAMREE